MISWFEAWQHDVISSNVFVGTENLLAEKLLTKKFLTRKLFSKIVKINKNIVEFFKENNVSLNDSSKHVKSQNLTSGKLYLGILL